MNYSFQMMPGTNCSVFLRWEGDVCGFVFDEGNLDSVRDGKVPDVAMVYSLQTLRRKYEGYPFPEFRPNFLAREMLRHHVNAQPTQADAEWLYWLEREDGHRA